MNIHNRILYMLFSCMKNRIAYMGCTFCFLSSNNNQTGTRRLLSRNCIHLSQLHSIFLCLRRILYYIYCIELVMNINRIFKDMISIYCCLKKIQLNTQNNRYHRYIGHSLTGNLRMIRCSYSS